MPNIARIAAGVAQLTVSSGSLQRRLLACASSNVQAMMACKLELEQPKRPERRDVTLRHQALRSSATAIFGVPHRRGAQDIEGWASGVKAPPAGPRSAAMKST